ncbi:MAG: alpha/beta hydrolase [Muribaculaceae bacterium]|nr:alpha/beta hydrolase [Muribaculaceae bacterium]
MRRITSFLLIFFITLSATAMSLAGKWEGALSLGPQKIPVAFNITQADAGKWHVTLDVPSQGGYGIPCEATVGDNKIEIKMDAMNASYNGTITSDNTIKGTFSQRGFNLPLELTKKESNSNDRIEPQQQQRREQAVSFTSDGVTLSGTLELPSRSDVATPYPAVVLVSGSGTQDRDETILGHKPFKEISNYLADNGIAVLRYDDRGAGESGPLKGNETTIDFARDAHAAFECLASQPNIDARRMGYIGHSEGGLIAFINAAGNPGVGFVISLAGPAVKGNELMVKQNLALLEARGIPYTQAQVDELNTIFNNIVTTNDTLKLREVLRANLAASTLQRYTSEQLDQSVAVMTSPWYISFIRFNPTPYLQQITCPMLALGGEWDFQVDAEQNLAAIKANVKNATCVGLPRHNHLFQEANSRIESLNYGALGNISKLTLETILDFIKGNGSSQTNNSER